MYAVMQSSCIAAVHTDPDLRPEQLMDEVEAHEQEIARVERLMILEKQQHNVDTERLDQELERVNAEIEKFWSSTIRPLWGIRK